MTACLSALETNNCFFFFFPFFLFLFSCPFLLCRRDEAIRHRVALDRLTCHTVIEKLQRDDEGASAASITCAVLPAVSGQVPAASKGAAVSSGTELFST